jgi:hypothetical protein
VLNVLEEHLDAPAAFVEPDDARGGSLEVDGQESPSRALCKLRRNCSLAGALRRRWRAQSTQWATMRMVEESTAWMARLNPRGNMKVFTPKPGLEALRWLSVSQNNRSAIAPSCPRFGVGEGVFRWGSGPADP